MFFIIIVLVCIQRVCMNHIKLLIKAGIYHFIDIEFCCKVFMPVLDIKLIYLSSLKMLYFFRICAKLYKIQYYKKPQKNTNLQNVKNSNYLEVYKSEYNRRHIKLEIALQTTFSFSYAKREEKKFWFRKQLQNTSLIIFNHLNHSQLFVTFLKNRKTGYLLHEEVLRKGACHQQK